jgi:hypothetical protein
MEVIKIYIFVIQKLFLCNLEEISLVYNLHIEKQCGICLIFFKSNTVSFRCFVDISDVPSTKEQLVDGSLGEASDVSQVQSGENPFQGENIHLLPDSVDEKSRAINDFYVSDN